MLRQYHVARNWFDEVRARVQRSKQGALNGRAPANRFYRAVAQSGAIQAFLNRPAAETISGAARGGA